MTTSESDDNRTVDELIAEVVDALTKQLGRIPTENEVVIFIWGTREARGKIWNQGVVDGQVPEH